MRPNHLRLHVSDFDRSRGFHETHCGFREHGTHGSILFLRDEAGLDLALAPADETELCCVRFQDPDVDHIEVHWESALRAGGRSRR